MFSSIASRIVAFFLAALAINYADVVFLQPIEFALVAFSFILMLLPVFAGDLLAKPMERLPQVVLVGTTISALLGPIGYGVYLLASESQALLATVCVVTGLVVCAAAAFGLYKRPNAAASVCTTAIVLMAAFTITHHQESTLELLKPGTEWLRLGLFLGTWLVSVGLLPLSVARVQATWSSEVTTGSWIACAVSFVAGVGFLEVDRTQYVGLYTHLHYWLQFVGLVSLQVAFTIVVGRILSGDNIRKLITIATLLILTGGVFWFFTTDNATSPIVRARLAKSSRSALTMELRPGEALRGFETANHPRLAFERYENDVSDKKLNIVVISIDALRGDYVGKDEPHAKYAPVMTELATDSLSFKYAYAPGNRTAIGMGSFFAGRYSAEIDWQLWIWRKGTILDPKKYDEEARKKIGKYGYTTIPAFPKKGTITERIKKMGYKTLATPYMTAGFFARGVGFEKGFDVYDLPRIPKKTPTSGTVLNQALKTLDETRDPQTPFFQWVHLFDPHSSGIKRKRYNKLVKQTDTAVGNYFDGLKERGLWDETAIILISDHGEGLGDHKWKHHGTSLYDDQVRVPFIVRIPGTKPRFVDSVASTIDGAITAVALAGGETDGLTGVNLIPVANGKPYPMSRPVFTEMHRYRGNSGRHNEDGKAVIWDGWKLFYNRKKSWFQLFNLNDDPNEKTDLFTTVPGRANEGLEILLSFNNPREREFPLPDIEPPPIE